MTRRAIIFDLDETLYRERRFVLSGYHAVASAAALESGVPEREILTVLVGALRRGRRARAFQDVCECFGLPAGNTSRWLAIYRAHEPRLRLPRPSRETLLSLRPSWRTGILTNGLPSVQAAKVRALRLRDLVDAVVYADEFDGGKPSAAPFLEMLARLGSEPARAVFAGDDPVRDIGGAMQVGMRTVLVRRSAMSGMAAGPEPDAVVRSVSEIPSIAARWIGEELAYVH
ncbi:MAG TPA: HAD family hydrolase [Vicinamibacterales bacterium]|jgi:putative hydrolase of the HAD superfamily